jgi:post-segregation antitoxin (ccd killing protein)
MDNCKSLLSRAAVTLHREFVSLDRSRGFDVSAAAKDAPEIEIH